MNRFALVVLCSVTASLVAQQPAVPAFEVVSIKPNNGVGGNRMIAATGGQFRVVGLPLKAIINYAYDLRDIGLTGNYDMALQWTSTLAQPNATDTSDVLSVFTALQEQLGLKLEPARGPVEVLVIDSVERPTPD